MVENWENLRIWRFQTLEVWRFGGWKFQTLDNLTIGNLEIWIFHCGEFRQFENLFGDLEVRNFKHLTTWLDLIIENFEIWISAVRKFVWRLGGWKFQTLDNLTWLDNWKFRKLKFSLEFPQFENLFGDLKLGNFKHLTTWLDNWKFRNLNFGSSKICLEIWRLEISNTWQLEISKFEIFTVGNFGSLKICLEIWKLEISNTWQLDNWKFRNLKFSLKFPQFENLFGDLKLGNFKHLTTWLDLTIGNFEIWNFHWNFQFENLLSKKFKNLIANKLNNFLASLLKDLWNPQFKIKIPPIF